MYAVLRCKAVGQALSPANRLAHLPPKCIQLIFGGVSAAPRGTVSDRAILFLFSVVVEIASLAATGWLLISGQAGSVDGLFLLLTCLLVALAFGLYLAFMIRRAMEPAPAPAAQPAKASPAAPAAPKPAPVTQP